MTGEGGVRVAVDLGASTGKVHAGGMRDGRLVVREVHRFATGAVEVGGTLRWDLPRLCREVEAGLAAAGVAAGGRPVASVAVDAWGVDYGLLARGRLVEPPYCYRDARTAGGVAELHARIDPGALYAATGVGTAEINTSVQLLRADPAALAAADTLTFVSGLLTHHLAGDPRVDPTIASTSQLWDPTAGAWSAQACAAVGVRPGLLPEVVPAGTSAGPVRAAVAARAGLGGTPDVLVGPGHDTEAAALALPTEHAAPVVVSCGTWSLVGQHLPAPVLTEGARTAGFSNEAMPVGTLLVRNLTGLWLLQECLRAWARDGSGPGDTAALVAALEDDTGPGDALASPWPLVDPADPAFLAPGAMPARIVAWCTDRGLPAPRGPREIAATVVRSLALAHADAVASLEALSGLRPAVVHVVGGGSRLRLLCRATADALGRPVVAGPAEASATGNVLSQLVAAGELASLAQARRVVLETGDAEVHEPAGGRLAGGLPAFRSLVAGTDGRDGAAGRSAAGRRTS